MNRLIPGLAIAALVLFVLSQLVLRSWLGQAALSEQQRWQHGVTWSLAEPASLVGGGPVKVKQWRPEGETLVIDASGGDSYLSLNFSGRRLPASHLHRLELTINPQTETVVRWFHRSRLDGPIASSAPMRLAAGPQILAIDLAASAWAGPAGETMRWGQDDDAVATLRLHPAAAGPVTIGLAQLSLLPTAPVAPRTTVAGRLPVPANTKPSIVVLPALTLAPGAWLRDQRDRLQWGQPGTTLTLARTLPDLAPGWWALLLLMPLVIAWRGATGRLRVIWVGLPFALVLALGSIAWSGPALVVLGLYLAAAVVTARPRIPLLVGSVRAWRDAAGLLVLLLLPTAPFLLDYTDTASPHQFNGLYPAWALVQQWLLCCILWPLSGRVWARAGSRVAACAGLFALAHLPNFELSLLTLTLAALTVALFARHKALLPVAALHAAAGMLYLQVLPQWLLYSGRVGAHYWN